MSGSYIVLQAEMDGSTTSLFSQGKKPPGGFHLDALSQLIQWKLPTAPPSCIAQLTVCKDKRETTLCFNYIKQSAAWAVCTAESFNTRFLLESFFP